MITSQTDRSATCGQTSHTQNYIEYTSSRKGIELTKFVVKDIVCLER